MVKTLRLSNMRTLRPCGSLWGLGGGRLDRRKYYRGRGEVWGNIMVSDERELPIT